MVACGLIGAQGLFDSFATLGYLREGGLPDIATVTAAVMEGEQLPEALAVAARLHTLGDVVSVAFPLSAARLILSILLVISSGLALSGRPGARVLALQALLANAALSIASFWLLRTARWAWIDTVTRVIADIPRLPSAVSHEQQERWAAMRALYMSRPFWLWFERTRLGLIELFVPALAMLALVNARTKAFFDAARRAAEQAEEEP
jgi:hypothetical protein